MVEAGSQAKKKIKLMEFKHPKYYKELKEFGKRGDRGKPTAASPDTDQVISKEPATAGNQRAPGPGLKPQAPSAKLQAPKLSNQPTQASSPQAKGSSFKPEVTSSKILEPGYKRTSLGSGVQATRTNEFFG